MSPKLNSEISESKPTPLAVTTGTLESQAWYKIPEAFIEYCKEVGFSPDLALDGLLNFFDTIDQ